MREFKSSAQRLLYRCNQAERLERRRPLRAASWKFRPTERYTVGTSTQMGHVHPDRQALFWEVLATAEDAVQSVSPALHRGAARARTVIDKLQAVLI